MTKMIVTSHSERSSVSKRSQEPYRKVRNSGREPRSDNVRESVMYGHAHIAKVWIDRIRLPTLLVVS